MSQVAKLLADVLKLRALDVAWLTKDSGRKIGDPANDDVPERIALFKHLVSCLSKDPEACKLVSQFEHLTQNPGFENEKN